MENPFLTTMKPACSGRREYHFSSSDWSRSRTLRGPEGTATIPCHWYPRLSQRSHAEASLRARAGTLCAKVCGIVLLTSPRTLFTILCPQPVLVLFLIGEI